MPFTEFTVAIVGTAEVENDEVDFVVLEADGGDVNKLGRLASVTGASLAPVEWRLRLDDFDGVVLPEVFGTGRVFAVGSCGV